MQALLWAWTHALPVRLQRPEGDAARLPSMAPGALPPPLEPALQQPVACSMGKEADDRRISSGEAQSCSVEATSIGRAQQVTWAGDMIFLPESAGEYQQMHAAITFETLRSTMLAVVVVLALLLLLLVVLQHM